MVVAGGVVCCDGVMADRGGRQQVGSGALSPPQLQAISVAVADAVTQALQQSQEEPDPRAVPRRGQGREVVR